MIAPIFVSEYNDSASREQSQTGLDSAETQPIFVSEYNDSASREQSQTGLNSAETQPIFVSEYKGTTIAWALSSKSANIFLNTI